MKVGNEHHHGSNVITGWHTCPKKQHRKKMQSDYARASALMIQAFGAWRLALSAKVSV
jgi:hypothetical protein